jgi:predicted acetyltransferase
MRLRNGSTMSIEACATHRWPVVGKDGAQVERGGEGRLQMDVSALGPLYSGYFSASILQELGKLQGDLASVALADQLFAAPVPWMREIY